MPSVVDGKMHYDLTPEQLAEYQARFVTELGVQVVGGCCGTTPDHIGLLADTVQEPHARGPHPGARAVGHVDLLPRRRSSRTRRS